MHRALPEHLFPSGANEVTRANAGGPPRFPVRTRWAARIAQFLRWAASPHTSTQLGLWLRQD